MKHKRLNKSQRKSIKTFRKQRLQARGKGWVTMT